MNSATLESIEANIYALPLNEQLLLMEHLAARIREKAVRSLAAREEQLAAMAADPDIQREIRQIEVEFAGTENDGLNAVV